MADFENEPTETERFVLRRLQLERQRLRVRGRHLLKTYRQHLRDAQAGGRTPSEA